MTTRKRVLVSMVSLGVAAFALWCWPHAATRPVVAQEKRSGSEVAFEKTVRPATIPTRPSGPCGNTCKPLSSG
jgi:hypothetical protein